MSDVKVYFKFQLSDRSTGFDTAHLRRAVETTIHTGEMDIA